MIFVTSFIGEDGHEYEGERLNAVCWSDAEQQALNLGVNLIGLLIEEHILDDEGNTIETIDYDNIQNN